MAVQFQPVDPAAVESLLDRVHQELAEVETEIAEAEVREGCMNSDRSARDAELIGKYKIGQGH